MAPPRELRPKLHSDRQGAAGVASPPASPPPVPSFDRSSMESTFASLWRSSGLADWADQQDRLDRQQQQHREKVGQREVHSYSNHPRPPRENSTSTSTSTGTGTGCHSPHFRNSKSTDCRVTKTHAPQRSQDSTTSRSSMRIEAIVDDHPSDTVSRAASPTPRYQARDVLPPIQALHPLLHKHPLHFRNTEVSI